MVHKLFMVYNVNISTIPIHITYCAILGQINVLTSWSSMKEISSCRYYHKHTGYIPNTIPVLRKVGLSNFQCCVYRAFWNCSSVDWDTPPAPAACATYRGQRFRCVRKSGRVNSKYVPDNVFITSLVWPLLKTCSWEWTHLFGSSLI